ncbi:hypothetical protein L210DRAFT_3510512, partial [Boletus edulis BED1]
MTDSTESVPIHPVAPRLKNGPKTPHLGPDIDAYRAAHALTVADDSEEWWAKVARETLHWHTPFHSVRVGGFETGDIAWFPEGGLNASYKLCGSLGAPVSRQDCHHLRGDEPGDGRLITFAELL